MSAHDLYAEMIRDTAHECTLLRADVDALRSLLTAALLLIPPKGYAGFKRDASLLLREVAKPMSQRFNEAVGAELVRGVLNG
jgi:hypothetical protein